METRRNKQQDTNAISVEAKGSLLTNHLAIQCHVLSLGFSVYSTVEAATAFPSLSFFATFLSIVGHVGLVVVHAMLTELRGASFLRDLLT